MRAFIKSIPVALLALLSWALVRPASLGPSWSEVTDAQLEQGEKVFTTHCKSCHLERGKSRIKRLNLSDDKWMHGAEPSEIEANIAQGIPATQMQPFKEKLSKDEIAAVARYVLTLSQPAAEP